MDGVLVDNMAVHMDAFAEVARRHGVEFDIEEVLGMAGKGNDEIFGTLFPAETVEKIGWRTLGEEKEAIYREMYAPKLKQVAGLTGFLESLKAAGIKIAVGTSAGKANMDFILDGLNIRRFFDAAVNADMVTRCKPDPEIYLTALMELGLTGAECLVFEDAQAGIQAALGAGIKVVAVATSADKAILEKMDGVVLVIKDFTEIDMDKARSLARHP